MGINKIDQSIKRVAINRAKNFNRRLALLNMIMSGGIAHAFLQSIASHETASKREPRDEKWIR